MPDHWKLLRANLAVTIGLVGGAIAGLVVVSVAIAVAIDNCCTPRHEHISPFARSYGVAAAVISLACILFTVLLSIWGQFIARVFGATTIIMYFEVYSISVAMCAFQAFHVTVTDPVMIPFAELLLAGAIVGLPIVIVAVHASARLLDRS